MRYLIKVNSDTALPILAEVYFLISVQPGGERKDVDGLTVVLYLLVVLDRLS